MDVCGYECVSIAWTMNVPMSMCVHMCLCTYVSVCVCVCVHICLRAYVIHGERVDVMSVCVWAGVVLWVLADLSVCRCVRTRACVCVPVRLHD